MHVRFRNICPASSIDWTLLRGSPSVLGGVPVVVHHKRAQACSGYSDQDLYTASDEPALSTIENIYSHDQT